MHKYNDHYQDTKTSRKTSPKKDKMDDERLTSEYLEELITREQYNGVDKNNFKKYQKEIEEYDGEIPFYLYNFINIINRIKYLKKVNNQYERAKLEEHRKNIDVDNEIEEFISWINDNPYFEEIIKIK